MQAYAGLPQSRLFPINVIAIFLNKWIYQKKQGFNESLQSSTCYKTLRQLNLKIKNSPMKSSKVKKHSESLVTKESKFNENMFRMSCLLF